MPAVNTSPNAKVYNSRVKWIDSDSVRRFIREGDLMTAGAAAEHLQAVFIIDLL